jgi:penicillin-binding protein 1A
LSPIFWVAFKPESEPRRQATRQELVAAQSAKPKASVVHNDSDFLQQQGGIY